MEGKGDLQCSQNITMNPEKHSHEMVLTMQWVWLMHYLIIKNECYSLNIKTCHHFTPPWPGPAVPSVLPSFSSSFLLRFRFITRAYAGEGLKTWEMGQYQSPNYLEAT